MPAVFLSPRKESNPDLSLRTGLLYPLSYEGSKGLHEHVLPLPRAGPSDASLTGTRTHCSTEELDIQQVSELCLVEADDEIVPHGNDRYAHLTGFLDHLAALLKIGRNIELFKGDIIFFEKLLCRVTEMARRR